MTIEEKLKYQLGRISILEELVKLGRQKGIVSLSRSNLEEYLTEEQDKHDVLLKSDDYIPNEIKNLYFFKNSVVLHWKIYGFEKQHYIAENFIKCFGKNPFVEGSADYKGE